MSNGCWATTTTAKRFCSNCGERVYRYWFEQSWVNGEMRHKRICEKCFVVPANVPEKVDAVMDSIPEQSPDPNRMDDSTSSIRGRECHIEYLEHTEAAQQSPLKLLSVDAEWPQLTSLGYTNPAGIGMSDGLSLFNSTHPVDEPKVEFGIGDNIGFDLAYPELDGMEDRYGKLEDYVPVRRQED